MMLPNGTLSYKYLVETPETPYSAPKADIPTALKASLFIVGVNFENLLRILAVIRQHDVTDVPAVVVKLLDQVAADLVASMQ